MNTINKSPSGISRQSNDIDTNSENTKCCLCNSTNDLVTLKGRNVCKECIKGLAKLK